MIHYIKGDLLRSDCQVIVHGCNCFCTMGSGIARQVKEMFPRAYGADLKTVKGDPSKLGTYTYADYSKEESPLFIINAYTQFDYGRDSSKVYLKYEALTSALKDIKANFNPSLKLGMPKIGCGLAKGDWNKVEKIIEEIFDDRDVYVYELV